MPDNPRKASDVLIELENKLNILLGIVRSQDLNIKILSNKLNVLLEQAEKASASKFSVESINQRPNLTVDPERAIPISNELNLQIETSPVGFRRTSRPETYDKPSQKTNDPPEVFVPYTPSPKDQKIPTKEQKITDYAVPVSQRATNKDGKSLFMADVEIIDLSTMKSYHKTRTNGTGKWSAALAPGNYRVFINKGASSTSPKLEAVQEVQINRNDSKMELQPIILRATK